MILRKNFPLKVILILLLSSIIYSCNKNENSGMIIEKLEQLKKVPKFKQEGLYPGLANEQQREALSKKLDEVIDEFKKGAKNGYNNKQYQDLMRKNISKFDSFNLDTEDREYICGFFERIMDAIGLKSSGGILNEWLYGKRF